jgi:hypothetical protein
MTAGEFWACVVINVILFMILNIWLLWGWALLISIVLVWGGFLIISGDVNIFD